VCVNDRGNHDAAAAVVRSIEEAGGTAIAVAADMGAEADVIRLFGLTRAADRLRT